MEKTITLHCHAGSVCLLSVLQNVAFVLSVMDLHIALWQTPVCRNLVLFPFSVKEMRNDRIFYTACKICRDDNQKFFGWMVRSVAESSLLNPRNS